MNDMDLEIFGAFVEEGLEMIDDVEPQLVELETTQDAAGNVDLEMVNSIFRLFHSMKGSAGFLELNQIVALTHRAENLLDIFRKEEALLEGPDISLLLQTIDLLRKVMDDLADTGQDDTFTDEVTAQVAALQVSIEAKANAPAPAEMPAAAEPNVEAEATAEPAAESAAELTADEANALDFPSITITPEMSARFMEEAEELLDLAEQNLLQVLSDENDDVDLSEALRAFHSFKGNSGFMGFSQLEDLTHRIETVLEKVVDGTVPANEDSMAVFLKIVDTTRKAVNDIGGGGEGQIGDLAKLKADLDQLVGADVKSDTPAPAAKPAAKPAATEEAAPRKGFIPLGGMKTKKPAPKAPAPAPAPAPAAAKTENVAAPQAASAKPTAAAQKKSTDTRKSDNAKTKPSGSIRVDLAKLDTLMNLVGELVIAETMVTRNPDLDGQEFENLEKASHHLRRITSDLQDVAMSVRMVPLSGTFKKMVRLVHDTALKAGKKVELKLHGEETEVDKTVIEKISDPLVHIVRNAIDHGLEKPEVRLERGKTEHGTVTIEARHESGEVWIIVSDDGGGMPRDIILDKAISKGLVEGDGADMRDEDVYKLVFEPGFSTAAQVTEISGRGVGMDVVKKNIEKINGRVDIKSTLGKGSSFIMRIPLTMAIIEGMLVRVGRSTYNIPMLSIREAFRPIESQITLTPDGTEVVKLRDELIPVVRMHQLYNLPSDCQELIEGIVVIVENDGTTAALFADEILGQQQTVVKGLSNYVGQPHGVSGCTILGDGSISLILDVATILASAATAPMATV